MSDCKPTKKGGVSEPKVNLSSISNVLKLILNAFNMVKRPANDIPPFLLLSGAKMKPGMSGRELAANTISRMESEAGIPMGDIFDDGPNAITSAVLIAAQEQVSHIQQNAKITTVIDPGAIQVTATGSAGPIPVVVQGSNVTLGKGNGVVQ